MVVGGVELMVLLFGIGGFVVVCVLLICNDDLVIVLCLWDKDCDGFVLGEGLGVMVFEEYEVVKVCGVKIYVEVVGFGMMGDVYYMIVLNMDGLCCCMVVVLCDVGLNVDEV